MCLKSHVNELPNKFSNYFQKFNIFFYFRINLDMDDLVDIAVTAETESVKIGV